MIFLLWTPLRIRAAFCVRVVYKRALKAFKYTHNAYADSGAKAKTAITEERS